MLSFINVDVLVFTFEFFCLRNNNLRSGQTKMHSRESSVLYMLNNKISKIVSKNYNNSFKSFINILEVYCLNFKIINGENEKLVVYMKNR